MGEAFLNQFLKFLECFKWSGVPDMKVFKNFDNVVTIVTPTVRDNNYSWVDKCEKFKQQFEPEYVLTCFPWIDNLVTPDLDGIIKIVFYTSLGEELSSRKLRHDKTYPIHEGWIEVKNKNDWRN